MTRLSTSTFDSGEELTYRSVSRRALVGTGLAIVSPLAFLHPVLWVAPALAAAICLWAVWEISAEPQRLAGRGVALVGLALSLIVGATAIARYTAHRAMAEDEARQVIDLWFEHLRNDEPHRAHQLSISPRERFPADEEDLWGAYRSVPRESARLKEFVAGPEVAALLALGPKAEARYYKTRGYTSGSSDGVLTVYAVTYDEGGQRKTFFMDVLAIRDGKAPQGENPWYLARIDGGVRPSGF